MKTTILKHRFLYLFLILGLTLSYTSCKEDEEESQTFLEMYDGTKWHGAEDGEEGVYLRINNNTNNPFDHWWFFVEYDCYDFFNSSEINDMEIIENTNGNLIIKYTEEEILIVTLTFTIQGEILKVVSVYDGEDGNTYYFDQSSVNVDDLVICD